MADNVIFLKFNSLTLPGVKVSQKRRSQVLWKKGGEGGRYLIP